MSRGTNMGEAKHLIGFIAGVLICSLLTVGRGLSAENVPLFDGSDSYVNVGTPAALQIPSNDPFTIEGWMLFNSIDTRDMLYSKNNAKSGPAYSYLLGFADYDLAAYNTAWRGNYAVSRQLDRWYHLAFAFDGSTMFFYLDGALAGSTAFSFSNNEEHSVKLGGYSSSLGDIRGI